MGRGLWVSGFDVGCCCWSAVTARCGSAAAANALPMVLSTCAGRAPLPSVRTRNFVCHCIPFFAQRYAVLGAWQHSDTAAGLCAGALGVARGWERLARGVAGQLHGMSVV